MDMDYRLSISPYHRAPCVASLFGLVCLPPAASALAQESGDDEASPVDVVDGQWSMDERTVGFVRGAIG